MSKVLYERIAEPRMSIYVQPMSFGALKRSGSGVNKGPANFLRRGATMISHMGPGSPLKKFARSNTLAKNKMKTLNTE